MAVAAVLGALGGIAGTLGGINTGYSKMTTPTLSPAQQLQNLMMMQSISPYMKGHFSKLAELGQASPNAYNSLLTSFMGDYAQSVRVPALQRQQKMMQGMGDNAHRRASEYTRQDFLNASRLGANSLKNSLMLRDLGMQTEGLDNAANRRLMALGGMSDTWMMPMGKTRENYYTPGFDYSSAIGGGLTALSALGRTMGNIGTAYGNAGDGYSGGF